MKNIKYILSFFLSLALITSCQEDDLTIGDISAPSNIEISITYIDDGVVSAAPGLGSGVVEFTASATNATAFHFVIQDVTELQTEGVLSHNFTLLGTNTYTVTVIAYGTGGNSSSKTFEIDVLALYDPPADLKEMLHANGTRTWKIAADLPVHFGLGPPGGSNIGEWWPGSTNTDTNYKPDVGMYDDRYIFNVDGTFTHVTNIDSGDITGTVFGRDPLINELGSSGGTVDGADILNLPYNDYQENWTLTAPGGIETISLTGLGFMGYYTGGNHKYRIFIRSANEMVLSTLDGNGEFEWWFKLIPE